MAGNRHFYTQEGDEMIKEHNNEPGGKKIIILAVIMVMCYRPVSAADFPYIIPSAISPEDAIQLFAREFPYRENIHYPEARERVVASALSAIGRVPYFWGGKYALDGSYPDWGEPSKVYSKGSKTTGTILPYGLDCSGFIQWAFLDGTGEDAGIGISTMSQWSATYPVSLNEAIPGDLLFLHEPGKGKNHVGIYLGMGLNGMGYVVHCTASMGGVCISGLREAGLTVARRVY